MAVGSGPGVSRIHVVIPHHRGRALLERCLRTLLESEGVALEIIIVANGCREPLPEIAERGGRIHVFRSEEGLGFSAANNFGVGWARAHLGAPDFYFFGNNDTEIARETLALLTHAIEGNPGCGIVGPRIMILGAPDHLNSLGLNLTRSGEAWDEGIGEHLAAYGPLPPPRPVLAVTGSAILIRAKLLEELGGWEEIYDFYYEDLDLCLRARSHGWDVVVEPRAVLWHAISATAGIGSEFKLMRTWRNRLILLAVHWPVPLLLRALPSVLLSELRLWARSLRAGDTARLRLQKEAWAGALRSLPRAIRLRRRDGGNHQWVRFLKPPGSVPVIRLPELDGHTEGGLPEFEPAQGSSP